MKYEDALIEFLSEPDNLKIALEISDNINAIKMTIEKKWWVALEAFVESVIKKLELTKWSVRLDDPKKIGERYYGLYIRQGECFSPKDDCSTGKVLDYRFSSEWGAIYFGVCWNNDEVFSKDYNNSNTEKLKMQLQDLEFTISGGRWPAYKKCIDLTTEDLIKISRDPAAVVAEIEDPVMGLIESTYEQVEEINAQMCG